MKAYPSIRNQYYRLQMSLDLGLNKGKIEVDLV